MWVGFMWRAALSPGRRAHSALAQLRCILDSELEGIRGAGTWKSERVITSRQGPCIRVEGISGGNFPSLGVLVPGQEPFQGLHVNGGSRVGVGEAHALSCLAVWGTVWPPSVNSTCLNLFHTGDLPVSNFWVQRAGLQQDPTL